MPRLTQSVPKYRKHRGSGQALVTINGRDYYLGPHGTKASKLEYDRLITEWLTSGRSVSFGAQQHEASVVELAADYVKHAKKYYGTGPNSELHRIVLVLRPVKALYGRTRAVDFGVLEFKAVRQRLIDDGHTRQGINASMRRIARMFRWAAAEGRIDPAVPQRLAIVPGLRRGKTEARESDPVEPVDNAMVDATLPHMSDVVADMVRIQRLTGMRPAEVCMVRPSDIDRSGEIWEYRPESHKTQHHGRDRVIFLGPQAQSVLLRYLARDPAMNCFRPCDSEAKRRAAQHSARKTPLSCGNVPGSNRKRRPRRQAGEYYDPRSYRRAVNYACQRAFPAPDDIKADEEALAEWRREHSWSPGQLRHTTATEIRKRFGLEAAQVALGHSQANVTQIYAERDYALAARVALEVG